MNAEGDTSRPGSSPPKMKFPRAKTPDLLEECTHVYISHYCLSNTRIMPIQPFSVRPFLFVASF